MHEAAFNRWRRRQLELPFRPDNRKGFRDIGRSAIRLKRQDSKLTERWPHLSRIFKRRHRAGPGFVSLCSCTVPLPEGIWKGRGPRSDSTLFHHLARYAWCFTSQRPDKTIRAFKKDICPFLYERFDLYATLGVGSMTAILPTPCTP
jgi:hypothetical protein